MNSRTFSFALLALGAALAPGAAAQNGGNHVPRELVHALLFGGGAPRGQPEPTVVVGRLPAEIDPRWIPAGASVVGGHTAPWGGLAVLTASRPPAEAISGWRAQLERAGWSASHFVEMREDVPAFQLCGPDGALLAAWATPRPQGGSELQLKLGTGPIASSPCAVARPATPGDVPFPELRVPEGAQPTTSSSGGSAQERSHETRLRTTREPAELATHYAVQFSLAGWNVTPPGADAGGAIARGEMRDARGRQWRALVAVLPVAEDERDVVVRVVTASPEPPAVAEWDPVTRATGAPVPRELARTLLARPAGNGVVEEPELVVGRLPRALAAAPLPAGARVVGGAEYASGAEGVVEVPGDLRQALAAYAAALELAGWRPHRWLAFAARDAGPATEYCAPDGESVSVRGTPLRDGGGYVKLQAAGPGRCTMPVGLEDTPLPVLATPAGAELRSDGGGGGGSQYEWDSRIRLATTLAPAALMAHYAALLRHAGWSILPPTVGEEMATATGELRDAQGRTWHALLAAVAVAPGERDVLVRVARPQP